VPVPALSSAHGTSRHGNVRFHHADIYHQIYNPQGQLEAQEFRFPFEDDSFDFAVVTSVFTHMLFATVDRYLGELSRIVAQGGHVLATFFILNDQSRALLAVLPTDVLNAAGWWLASE